MEGQQKRWGVTNSINDNPPTEADLKLNDQLVEYLKAIENFETPEGIEKRKKVLKHIEKVAEEFIRRVAKAKKVKDATLDSLGGAVFTYGSFSLGVYGPSSDIDTLIVAPRHVSLDDFFDLWPSTFREMSDAADIDEMVVVRDAFVPIIKMEYRKVSLDLIFASLPSQSSIPKDINFSDIKLFRGMDGIAMRSVNGIRVTKELLGNVPQHKSFRYALRAIKLWSKQRGLYGAVSGYPGGIAWAIMVARISQLFPYACGATLICKFFNIMRNWGWPRPCMLREVEKENALNLPVWNPAISHHDRAHKMPIITPAYPEMCATHSISKTTFDVIMTEFERANELAGAIQAGEKSWKDLFQRHTFFTQDHKYYLSIVATGLTKEAHDIFSGWVQSKFRLLAKGIEEGDAGIKYARPYMAGFERVHRCANEDQIERVKQGSVDFHVTKDQISHDGSQATNGETTTHIYTTTYYIGLTFPEEGAKSLDISFPVKDFRHLIEDAIIVDRNTMFVRVVHTRDHQLPDDVFVDGDVRPTKPIKEKKKKTNGTATKPKKRAHAEMGLDESRKSAKKRASETRNGLPTPTPA